MPELHAQLSGSVADGPTALSSASSTADGWPLHFLRFLAVTAVMVASIAVLVGFVWFAYVLSTTGRRWHDVLMLLVPFVSTVVLVQTIWRYTAKDVYWSPRPELASKSLFAR